jgi:hypothetical protein
MREGEREREREREREMIIFSHTKIDNRNPTNIVLRSRLCLNVIKIADKLDDNKLIDQAPCSQVSMDGFDLNSVF